MGCALQRLHSRGIRNTATTRVMDPHLRGDDGLMSSHFSLTGPLTRYGFFAAVIACLLDQVSKFYLLSVFNLAAHGPVRLGPFFDLVLARNTGINYRPFQTQGAFRQLVLLAVQACGL